MNDIKIDKWLIEDIAFTIGNFSERIKEWETKRWDPTYNEENPYILAANAALIVAKKGFGDCFLISDFIDCVNNGSFIDYDGTGYWADEEGNKLGCIYCDSEWLKKNQPEKAKFIIWYNK